MFEVLRHAVLVAAQLHAVDISVGHRHNLDVVLFHADWAAAVPCVPVERIELIGGNG